MKALVQDVQSLATCIAVVFGGEGGQIGQVVVSETALKGDGAPFCKIHVLVHPPALNARLSAPPDAQKHERVSAAMTNESALKDGLAVQIDAGHVRRQIRQLRDDFFSEIGFHNFVSVQAHYPIGRDWRVRKCPFELRGIVLKWMLQEMHTVLSRNFCGSVG